MLPGDSEETAQKSAGTLDDPRVLHFYDPNKRSGKAVADTIGWAGKVAWDIYLFYSEGGEWGKEPPLPTDWMHQLSDSRADRERYYTGDDLAKELYKAAKKLLST